MLKQTVKYKDYDDVECEDILYFNLSKTELSDMFDLQPRLEAWSKATSEDGHILTSPEIKELLDIIKFLIKSSYGVRSADGKRFQKSNELFEEFKQTAAYDTFVFGLFEDPPAAVAFMTGVMPKDLSDKVLKELPFLEGEKGTELNATEKEVPAYLREGREPNADEIRSMSTEELRTVFRQRSQDV